MVFFAIGMNCKIKLPYHLLMMCDTVTSIHIAIIHTHPNIYSVNNTHDIHEGPLYLLPLCPFPRLVRL